MNISKEDFIKWCEEHLKKLSDDLHIYSEDEYEDNDLTKDLLTSCVVVLCAEGVYYCFNDEDNNATLVSWDNVELTCNDTSFGGTDDCSFYDWNAGLLIEKATSGEIGTIPRFNTIVANPIPLGKPKKGNNKLWR